MPEPYRKDMSQAKWEEVFARQERRSALVTEWLDALELHPGDRVLDVGAGPGYVSLQAAKRVGPGGLVFAVDRSAEALAYLKQRQEEEGIANIRRIVADAATMEPVSEPPHGVLMTVMLHHDNEPALVLNHMASILPAGAHVVICEFHPDGPCQMGPPRHERLSPEQVQDWCQAAGFHSVGYRRQTDEHYMLVLERKV